MKYLNKKLKISRLGFLTLPFIIFATFIFLSGGPVKAAACATPTTDRGSVSSTINIPSTGTYRIWSRVMTGTASTDNSYSLEVSDAGNTNCYVVGDNDTIPANTWTWVDYQNGNASSKIDVNFTTTGNHNIKLIGREDGVKVDRVIAVTDTSCTPTGTGDNCAAPDTTAPTTSITAPTSGATVSGAVNITANASDDSGVVNKVEFYVDGSLVNTDISSPYAYSWDTTSGSVTNGSHNLTTKAYDGSNNIGTSTTIPVTVSNAAPTSPDLIVTNISWTPASPHPGDNVTFRATIKNQGTGATPASTIHGVLFSIDGDAVSWSDDNTNSLAAGASITLTANGGPSNVATWPAGTVGSYTVTASVDDLNRIVESDESNNALDASLSITTNPSDTQPPTVSITAPSGTVSGTTNITSTASDTGGSNLAGVQYYLDATDPIASPNTNKLGSLNTTSPFTYAWNTTTLSNGSHTIIAVATDGAGNAAASTVVTVTVNNVAPPDTSAPPTPGSPNSPSKTSTTASLAWNAVNDTPGGTVSGLAGYKVYRSTSSPTTGFSLLTSTTLLAYTDGTGTPLTPNTTYYYRITAYDNATNESALASGTTVTVTTNPNAPVASIAIGTSGSSTINSGSSSTLTFSATNSPTSCTHTSSPTNSTWNSSSATSGTNVSTGTLTVTTTFTLTCTNTGGTSSPANVTVTVNSVSPPSPTPPTPTPTPTPPPTTPPPTPTPTPPTPTKKGDLNNDNKVDIFDLSILLSRYGSTNAQADFNNSGHVDIIDLSVLLSNYGK